LEPQTLDAALPSLPRKLQAALRRSTPPHHHYLGDRVAEHMAVKVALGDDGEAYTLTHSPMGQPRLMRRPNVASHHGPICISFTHDADAHITALTRDPAVVGIGVDVVHLPRLSRGGHAGAHLMRFARRFMSDIEWAAFQPGAPTDDLALRRVVAARFSLMEAASKAIGTGLRLGMGFGRPASVLPQTINVMQIVPSVEYLLDGKAFERQKALRASRIEGFWAEDGEYLVSIALLYRGVARVI